MEIIENSFYDEELNKLFEESTFPLHLTNTKDESRGITRDQFKSIIRKKMDEAYEYGLKATSQLSVSEFIV